MNRRSQETDYCTFYVDDSRFAIDILTVQEVNRHCIVTPVFGAPSWVRGLLNLRGQVVTVIDAGIVLGRTARTTNASSRLIILKTNTELALRGLSHLQTCDDPVGIQVDSVSDVITLRPESLEPPPPCGIDSENRAISAILQLKKEIVRIVDPIQLLHFEEVDGAAG